LAAGIEHTSAPSVVVFAADLPWIAPAVAPLLAGLGPAGVGAAVLVDRDGRLNPLAAAWRRSTLVEALQSQPASGRSMRGLFEGIQVVQVRDEDHWGWDCDTEADLDQARAWLAAGH
jgi:molybdopterin-guanine dinucleotide biosynthesis protein A